MFQLKFFWRERYDTIFNYKNLNKSSEISWKQMNYLNFEMGMKLFVPTHGESPGDDHHSENDQKMEWNSKWNWKESTDIYRYMYWYIYIYIYGCYGVFHRWFPTATQWEELVELPCDGRWIRLYGRVLRRINSVSTEEVEDRIRRRRVTRWWNERPPSITGRAERVVREGERTWWWLYQECLMLSFGTHDRLSHPASRPGIKSWLAIIRS